MPDGAEATENVESPDSHEPVLTAPDANYADLVTVYDSSSDIRSPIKMFKGIFGDFYSGRELSWRLFMRNLQSLYRQTLLGLFWAFLPPIANTAMWIFLKSAGVFELKGTAIDATVYILTGMILWQAFIEAFQMPMNALGKNKNMLSKLRFPRESLLAVGFGEVMFNLGIRLLLLIPAFIWTQTALHWTVLLAPLGVIAIVFFGIALGLLIMPIGSLYQDVGRFITMAMPFWMIVTPIIYVPWDTYPGNLLNWVNPAAPLLLWTRDLLLIGPTSPHLLAGLIFAGMSIPLLLLGLVVYRVSLPVLIERMQA